MDQREARRYVSANPPPDPERRPSLLGRLLFRRSSSIDEGSITAASGLERRGSMDQPEVTGLTQRVQKEMVKKPTTNAPEFNILT